MHAFKMPDGVFLEMENDYLIAQLDFALLVRNMASVYDEAKKRGLCEDFEAALRIFYSYYLNGKRTDEFYTALSWFQKQAAADNTGPVNKVLICTALGAQTP